jgi:hypothetical protein
MDSSTRCLCPCNSCAIGSVDQQIQSLRHQLNEAIARKDNEAVLRISQKLCAKNLERSAIYRGQDES